MSANEIKLPYGTIKDKKLIMNFSAFDMDLPVIAAGVRERSDVLKEMQVAFSGFGTEVPEELSRQKPAEIKVFFEYLGKETDASIILKRVYHIVWGGIIQEFPDLIDWAEAKADLSSLTFAQAEVMRVRREK